MTLLPQFLRNIPWRQIFIYTGAIIVSVGIIILILLVFLVFFITTYRNPRKKRSRECASKKDELQIRMFTEGSAWAQRYKNKTESLHIVSGDGLNLYGEYTNFGFDKCCIILQGRVGSLLQCYYFADVYAKNGYNIFVFDFRTQGLSDGKYQTGGIKESDDLVLWIKYLNGKYNISDFTLHGVCIGAATAVYAYSKLKKEESGMENSRGLIKRIVCDGLYKTYFDLYKGHAKAYSGSMFPVYLYGVFFLLFILAGVRPFKENPMRHMKEIEIPILFIFSVMDKFCLKKYSEQLYKECASLHKEICFFSKGRHAHVRNSQSAEYDELIEKFLQKYI